MMVLGGKVAKIVVDFELRCTVWFSQWRKVDVVRLTGFGSGSVVLTGFGSG